MVTNQMPPLVDPGQLGVGGELGVEVEPLRVVPGDAMPELDEAQHLAGLVGAGQVGIGIAQGAAVRLVGEEGQDARAGLAAQGQVVVLQGLGVAAVGDGVEVEAERLGLGEQQRRQPGDPPRQELLLVGPRGAVGVVGGVALLGQDVQAGEQAERLVEVEVADVTAAFLVEQLQRQQAEQRGCGGDHARARIAGLS